MKVTPDGKVSTIATSRWPWVPVGVALSGSDLYVLERMGNPYGPSTILEVSTLADRLGSPRIRKVSPDGAITTLVVVKGDRGLAIIVNRLILMVESYQYRFWSPGYLGVMPHTSLQWLRS